MSDRIKPHYEAAGLLRYASGRNAMELSNDLLFDELDHGTSEVRVA